MKLRTLLKNMKLLLMLSAVFLMLQGCSTTVPLTMKFPQAPDSLMEKAPVLAPLTENEIQLSDILSNATENYGKFYELKARYNAWQEWYIKQKIIYEDIN